MTGGPDPHMAAVVVMCDGLQLAERLWRAWLYVAVYNVPTAEAIWREWPVGKFMAAPADAMVAWLDAHWAGLRLRRERRTVKSPRRLATCLAGFPDALANLPNYAGASFEDLWAFALSRPHIGRYAATKLAEIWHRLGFVSAEVPDIRAVGGWSPRKALGLIYSEEHVDFHDDGAAAVSAVEKRAAQLRATMRDRCGIDLSFFELEVMLCEYKESYGTRRQYPGRSLDSELTYEAAVNAYWKVSETDHMRARKLVSPPWALGEIRGWAGVRGELGRVLADYGYVWSDFLYDYAASVNRLDRPVANGLESQ